METFEEGQKEEDVLEEIYHYQSEEGELPDETNPRPYQSSIDASTSTSDTHFVCSDWVLHILVKKLKYLTRQFYLPAFIIKPSPNDRQHIPHPRMAALSEAIIQGGASLPLYLFLVEVLDYFNVVHFQFTPNSIRTMVAFYIAFMEADICEPSAIEFTYVYCMKTFARNEVFWYMSKWGLDVEEVWEFTIT